MERSLILDRSGLDEGTGNGHGCVDIVVLVKGLNMFEFSNLANGVFLLA